jgi:hypothetical protein
MAFVDMPKFHCGEQNSACMGQSGRVFPVKICNQGDVADERERVALGRTDTPPVSGQWTKVWPLSDVVVTVFEVLLANVPPPLTVPSLLEGP